MEKSVNCTLIWIRVCGFCHSSRFVLLKRLKNMGLLFFNGTSFAPSFLALFLRYVLGFVMVNAPFVVSKNNDNNNINTEIN